MAKGGGKDPASIIVELVASLARVKATAGLPPEILQVVARAEQALLEIIHRQQPQQQQPQAGPGQGPAPAGVSPGARLSPEAVQQTTQGMQPEGQELGAMAG